MHVNAKAHKGLRRQLLRASLPRRTSVASMLIQQGVPCGGGVQVCAMSLELCQWVRLDSQQVLEAGHIYPISSLVLMPIQSCGKMLPTRTRLSIPKLVKVPETSMLVLRAITRCSLLLPNVITQSAKRHREMAARSCAMVLHKGAARQGVQSSLLAGEASVISAMKQARAA